MAKKFIDLARSTVIDDKSISLSDGSALTLTNKLRVLYDDTCTRHELNVLMERARKVICELEPQ